MTYKKLIITTFLALIYLPFVTFIFQTDAQIKKNSKLERRSFHKAPSLTFDMDSLNAFPQAFELYFRDHFGMRHTFVHLHDQLIYRGFGMSPRRLYLPGRNGWFFRGYGSMRVQKNVDTSFDAVSDFMGQAPFTSAELKNWTRSLEARKKLVEKNGGKYIFAVAPTKPMIYPEYLPEEIRTRKGQSRAEQLTAYLKKHSDVEVVDLIAALKKAKDDRSRPDLYYKTDFHWNYYGAYWAYRALMEKAMRLLPKKKIRPAQLQDYQIRYKKNWVDAAFRSTFGVTVTDEYPVLSLKKDSSLYAKITTDKMSFFPKSKKREVTRYSNPRNVSLDSILIVGDSFIEKTAGFFAVDSKETYVLREITRFPSQVYRTDVKPELVIQSLMGDYLVMKNLSPKKRKR